MPLGGQKVFLKIWAPCWIAARLLEAGVRGECFVLPSAYHVTIRSMPTDHILGLLIAERSLRAERMRLRWVAKRKAEAKAGKKG